MLSRKIIERKEAGLILPQGCAASVVLYLIHGKKMTVWDECPLQDDEFVLSADEKTSIQARRRRHATYRDALTIELALKEISEESGTRFDPGVVDVCLRLFKENGYKMEG